MYNYNISVHVCVSSQTHVRTHSLAPSSWEVAAKKQKKERENDSRGCQTSDAKKHGLTSRQTNIFTDILVR
jgi:hypothetical protein